MSPHYDWESSPEQILNQLSRLTTGLITRLETMLVGIYLHGSLAMRCFNPDRSDIDVLVVLNSHMSSNIKRGVAEFLLWLSRRPTPIEISFLVESAIIPWEHPAPYDFHYSETWRDQLRHDLRAPDWENWNMRPSWDPDLAAHITIARRFGVTLYGKPVCEALPEVPPRDYIDAVLNDFADSYEHVLDNPRHDSVYFVLNACRIYAFLLEGHVYSKDMGATWALNQIPELHRPVVEYVQAVYRGGTPPEMPSDIAIKRFATYIGRQIELLMP